MDFQIFSIINNKCKFYYQFIKFYFTYMKKLELELDKMRQKNDQLLKLLKVKESQISKLIQQLEEVQLQNNSKTQNFSNQLTHPDSSGHLVQFQASQIHQKNKEISELNCKIQAQNTEIAQLRVLQQQHQASSEDVLENVKYLKSQLELHKDQAKQVQKCNDALVLEKAADAPFRIELEHLRAQNEILSNLLDNHPALKDDQNFARGQATVELKLLSKQKFPAKPSNIDRDFCQSCSREIYYYRPCCNLLAQIDDQLMFVPQGAFDFAKAFQTKYIHSKNDLLVEELIELLLFELNKFWYQREQSSLFRLKFQMNERIKELGRQIGGQSYDQKMMLQTIKRQKHQIRELTMENLNCFNSEKFQPKSVKV